MTPQLLILDFSMVVGGLALLLISGDFLVRGAVALAKKAQISPLVIGVTIVAFGTSAPELFIGLDAAMIGGDAMGIVMGNVVGSNIANVLLILGIPALISATTCNQHTLRRNTILMVLASMFFIYLCRDGLLTKGEGAVLFGLVLGFLAYSFWVARSASRNGHSQSELDELDDISNLPEGLPKISAFIVLSLVGLPIGAHLIVDGGTGLAKAAGVSASVIGLSLIALGTSLPELATTVVAALRKHSAMALGNVIGSNVFNILAIMGVTSLAAREAVPVDERFFETDFWVMLASSAILLPYVLLRLRIGWISGIAFVLAYGAYMVFLFRSG